MSEPRRVLVTGGSRGIGLAVSRALAAEGWRVIVASRDRARVDEAVTGLDGDGHLGVALDVSRPDEWEAAIGEIDGTGPLDGLVAAAGVLGPIGAVGTYDPEEFAATIAVNLTGTLLALHHALRGWRRRRGAR